MTNMRALVLLAALAQPLIACDGGSAAPPAPSPVTRTDAPQLTAPAGYVLTPSASTVAPGGQLTISWTVPTIGQLDWIGLYEVGAAPCAHGWSEYTNGKSAGTLSLTAPTLPGPYEFRYQPNNGCDDIVRSSVVRVASGG